MEIENLVKMANDISNFFDSDPDRTAAVNGVSVHIRKFWDPGMRLSIILLLNSGGRGLSELASAAISKLAMESDSLRQVGDG
jgi:formate dehydrogenase subunit delta